MTSRSCRNRIRSGRIDLPSIFHVKGRLFPESRFVADASGSFGAQCVRDAYANSFVAYASGSFGAFCFWLIRCLVHLNGACAEQAWPGHGSGRVRWGRGQARTSRHRSTSAIRCGDIRDVRNSPTESRFSAPCSNRCARCGWRGRRLRCRACRRRRSRTPGRLPRPLHRRR